MSLITIQKDSEMHTVKTIYLYSKFHMCIFLSIFFE